MRVSVLCYHSIHPDKHFASATPALFEEHLAWLQEHCDIISFEQALERARQGGGKRPAVAITFDDGYADNYDHAFPILASRSITADFFLTVGLLEGDPLVLKRFLNERAATQTEITALTWTAVEDMRQAGMRFHSHTWSHPNLARLDNQAAAIELRRSKEHLENRLGCQVPCIAYPYGKPRRHISKRIMELVGRSGYRYAAAVMFRGVRPTDDPLCLPRFYVVNDSVAALSAKVLGRLDGIGWWQERTPIWAGRIISPEDFAH
jgi:peptidoglycan/xylan/chitin deacetylase (PgdA/CDA1 family)